MSHSTGKGKEGGKGNEYFLRAYDGICVTGTHYMVAVFILFNFYRLCEVDVLTPSW